VHTTFDIKFAYLNNNKKKKNNNNNPLRANLAMCAETELYVSVYGPGVLRIVTFDHCDKIFRYINLE
jgi:hypothetical protein